MSSLAHRDDGLLDMVDWERECIPGSASRNAGSKVSISDVHRQVSIRAQGDRLELDPDNASILVCGGSGVALEITRKLKNMGSWVWMLQRSETNRKEIEGMMAIVSKGDALDTDSVAKAFDGEYCLA